MNVKDYLLKNGYTEEDAVTLSADAKMSKAIESAVRDYEAGVQARADAEAKLADARKRSDELNQWWKNEAQPALLNSDSSSASAKAEVARLKTYMKSMKDQGYPVEDSWLADGPITPATPVTPAAPAANSFDAGKFTQETASAMTTLYDLGEDYRELYGERMPNAQALLQEARGAGQPLSNYVRSKFNFDGKRKELSEKKEAERVERITRDITEKLEAKYAERNNPNLAPAVISKAAAVAESNKDHADSWKTKQGRAEAKRDRLVQFRNVLKSA